MNSNSSLKRRGEECNIEVLRKKQRKDDAPLQDLNPPVGSAKRIGSTIRVLKLDSEMDPRATAYTSPRNKFEYQALGDNKIRVVRIKPGNPADKLECELKIVDMDSCPYNALSYAWGTALQTRAIKVNGKTFHVRQNLFDFLGGIRSTSEKEEWLWIDQICIDQNNNDERSNQIRHMHEIYSNAEKVLVWLGREDADTQPAIEYMCKLLDPRTFKQERWIDDHRILALSRFMNRDWFSRRWIVQEIAHAKEVVLRCGNREVHFDDFMDAIEILESRLDDIKHHFGESTPFGDIYSTLMDDLRHSGAMRLVHVLNELRLRPRIGQTFRPIESLTSVITTLTHFHATDPKDAIYAVRSLAAMEHQASDVPTLQPDYNRSVLDTYTDTVMQSVRTSGSLDLILRPWAPIKKSKWSSRTLCPDLIYNVPSWIATVHELPYGDPSKGLRIRQAADSILGPLTKLNFNANGSRPADVIFGINDATRNVTGSLFAKGIMLGVIQRTSPRMSEGTVSKECLELIGGLSWDADGGVEAVDDKTWQVLCANIGPRGSPAPYLYGHAFRGIMQDNPTLCSLDTTELLADMSSNERSAEKDLLTQVQAVCWNRKVFRASAAHGAKDAALVGLAAKAAKEGDVLVIFYGCSVPVLMRPQRNEQDVIQWELLGEAYVHGQMDGEVFSAMTTEEVKAAEQTFEIR